MLERIANYAKSAQGYREDSAPNIMFVVAIHRYRATAEYRRHFDMMEPVRTRCVIANCVTKFTSIHSQGTRKLEALNVLVDMF